MKKNAYFLNMILMVLSFGLCLWAMLVRTFAPSVLLPHISIPMLVLVSSAALVLEKWLGGEGEREWIGCILLGGATFALLPVCADLNGDYGVVALFLVGAATFGLTTLLYTSMCERMRGGKLTALVNGGLLWLAAQFFQGIL